MTLRRWRSSAILYVNLAVVLSLSPALLRGSSLSVHAADARENHRVVAPVSAREQWLQRGRTGPGGTPAELRQRAEAQKLKLRADRVQQGKSAMVLPPARNKAVGIGAFQTSVAWTALGPSPVISDPGIYGQDYGNVSGRITAIAVDPNDATGNTVYAGAAYGGLWKSSNAAAAVSSVAWQPLLDAQPSLAVGAVAVQPGNANVLLVGTGEANGSSDSYYGLGILRSTDGGATWTQITMADSGSISFLGLGFQKIAFSSVNPNLVVAAVSSSTNGSALGAVSALAIAGLYYSADAGVTWHLASSTDSGVAISPAASASDVVFAAPVSGGIGTFYAALQNHGIYSSIDGQNWSRLATQPDATNLSSANCPAAASAGCAFYRGQLTVVSGRTELYTWYLDSTSADHGIFRSNDGGNTWASLDVTGIENCGDPTGCGTTASHGLYLAAAPNGPTGTDLYAGTTNLYRCSVTDATNVGDTCMAITGATSTSGFINLTHVFGCGSPLATTAHMHPDQYGAGVATLGAGSSLFFGNAGGVYRALSSAALIAGGVSSSACSGSNPIDNLTGTLGSLSEVVSFSQDATDSTTLLAGLQDNGSVAVAQAYNNAPRYGNGPLPLTTWTALGSGDAGFNEIDPATPNNWYTSLPNGEIDLCTAGETPSSLGCIEGGFRPVGVGYPQATANPWSADPTDFYLPFQFDPQLSGNLLVGTCRIWRGNGLTGAFTPISPEFDFLSINGCRGSAQVNRVRSIGAGGPATINGSQVIYAGTTGSGSPSPTTTPTGRVLISTSTDAGLTTWHDITGSINPLSFDISSIYVDNDNDPSGFTAYVTIMGFRGQSGGHIWKTTNAGAFWADISLTLPDVPVNSLLLDPLDHKTLYAGTDAGVFVSQTGGTSWAEYGTSLPNAPVTRLRAFNSGGVTDLRASTYGRGLWSIPLLGISTTAPNFAISGLASALTVNPGTSVVTSFSLTSTNGFAGDVTLACVNPPVGVTCIFSPNPVTLAANVVSTVTLTISATSTALAQLIQLPIQASSGTLIQQGILPLTVAGIQPSFVFQITSPAVISVVPGGSLVYGLSIIPQNGFNEPVTFTCSGGIPQGSSCSFSPAVVTGSGTSNMTLMTAPPAAASMRSEGASAIVASRSRTLLWLPLAAMALLGAGLRMRRKNLLRLLMLCLGALMLGGVMLWTACGGSSTPVTTTTGVAIAVSPTTATIFSGAQQAFTATVTGSTNTTVNWSASPGTIDTNGLYTAPFVTSTTATTATITATASADTTKSATAKVTVNAYTGGTPPGNYVITVTATSTHSSQSQTVMLTVQ